MSRFAYADPPYIGQAKRLYGKHRDYAGEVDHVDLIGRLASFDGWALSASMKSLRFLLPLCPDDVLVLSWVKPGQTPPMGDRRVYSWEPVILCPLRPPRDYVKTSLIQSPPGFFGHVTPNHVIGEKPPEFSRWVFENGGLLPSDEFVDLFPGSGAVGRAWEQWRRQTELGLVG